MPRQSKSTKNYKKNKKLQSSKIVAQKTKQIKKTTQQVRDQRLLEEEISDEEKEQQIHEQQYLLLTSKKKNKGPKEEKTISTKEIEDFLSLAKKESDKDDIDEKDMEELLKDVDEEKEVIHGCDDDDDEEEEDDDDEMKDDSNDNDDEGDDDEGDNEDGEDGEDAEEEDDDEGDEKGEENNESMENRLSQNVEESSDEEEILKEIEKEEKEKDEDETKKIEVTKEHVNNWILGMRQDNSLKCTKKILLATFVCAYQDEAAILNENEKDPKKLALKKMIDKNPFVITSNEIFLRVIVACAKYTIPVFDHYSKRDVSSNKLPDIRVSGWNKISVLVKNFIKTINSLLKNMANAETISYFLKYIIDAVPYFGHFVKESRYLLKCLLNLLGNSKEIVRFRAFLVIHRMGMILPYPFLDLCLKGIYFTLVKNAKNYNPRTFKTIDFLKNCVVEMYGIDPVTSYQHAYLYIRELAITLRRAIAGGEKNIHGICINWKYLNCLDTWCRVIGTHHKQLNELLYPLIQIILGTCELAHSDFLPARLKLLEMLNSLTKKTLVFIPVLPQIFNLFEMREMLEKPTRTIPRGIDFEFKIKVDKKIQKSREYQIRLREETLYLVLEFLSFHSTSFAFPELAFPVIKFLKRFKKMNEKALQFNKALLGKIRTITSKIQENVKLVMDKRMSLNKSPVQISRENKKLFPEDFLTPLQSYYEMENRIHLQAVSDRISARISSSTKDLQKMDNSDDDDEDGGNTEDDNEDGDDDDNINSNNSELDEKENDGDDEENYEAPPSNGKEKKLKKKKKNKTGAEPARNKRKKQENKKRKRKE